MTRTFRLLLGTAFLALAAGACEGPRGPAGPEGPQGPQGPPGEDGVDGALCVDCHTANDEFVAIQQQFELSPHGYASFELRGPDYAGGACIGCHTHQGYIAAATGTTADFTGGVAPMTCRTCHQVHTEMDRGDYALTLSGSVTLLLGGDAVELGKGAVCAACHQARVPAIVPEVGQDGQDTIPARLGTHRGPQATVFAAGPGLPVFYGTETVPTEPFASHVTFGGEAAVSCVGCHMQDPVGFELGSHNWGVVDGSGTVNNDGTCDACHVDVTAAFDGVKSEVQPLMADLLACLQSEGVVDSTGSANTGAVVDNDLIAAYLVWQTLDSDGSQGAHHPDYVPAILANANAYLDDHYSSCAP